MNDRIASRSYPWGRLVNGRGAFRSCLLIALLALPLGVATSAPAEDGPEATLDRAIRLADAARRRLLTEDACPYSPAGVVMRVGSDPEALAGFVRETIGYEPHLGVVRGARGTLAARAGGDWDRAVLLAALLAEAGHESKLIAFPRPDADRAARIDAFLSSRGRERAMGAAGSSAVIELPPPSPLLAEMGVSLPGLELDVARGAARWRRLLDESHDAAAGLAPVLEDALAAAKAPLGIPLEDWRRRLEAGAWERVLVRIGSRNLNPGPEALTGEVPVSAKTVDAPPGDRVAQLRIRIDMTVAGEGAPTRPVELLARDFPVGDLFARPIRIQIAPDGSAGGEEPPNEWSEAEWIEHLAGFERFQAVLEVGRLWIASDAFDVYGQTHKVKGDGRIEGAKRLGGGIHRGLGGFGGGGTKEPEKPKTRVGELILTLTVVRPHFQPIRVRRLIWGDLRRDVSPVWLTDLVVFGGPVGPDTLLWRAFDATTANVPFEARILSSDERYRMVRTEDMRMLHQIPQDWQLARLGLADRLLAADDGLTILGGPALVMKTAYLVPDAEAGEIRRRTVVDVAHDGLSLVPRTSEACERAAAANLRLGVASTVLESCLLRERRPTAETTGAYAAFEAAAVAARTPVVVRRSALEGVELPELGRWALTNAPELLVYPFPGGGSWFEIDPNTGAAIGRGGAGEGQSMAEYKAVIKNALKNLKCMLMLVNGMRQGQSDAKSSYEWMKCITGFDPAKASSYTGVAANYQKTVGVGSMWNTINDAVSGCEKLVARAQKQKARQQARESARR